LLGIQQLIAVRLLVVQRWNYCGDATSIPEGRRKPTFCQTFEIAQP
jgi:hypothetical protein